MTIDCTGRRLESPSSKASSFQELVRQVVVAKGSQKVAHTTLRTSILSHPVRFLPHLCHRNMSHGVLNEYSPHPLIVR